VNPSNRRFEESQGIFNHPYRVGGGVVSQGIDGALHPADAVVRRFSVGWG